jgi:hypothetical protein
VGWVRPSSPFLALDRRRRIKKKKKEEEEKGRTTQ